MLLKSIRRILLICFFGLLTGILHLIGNYAPDLVTLIYPAISQNVLRVIGGFFSVFPIAMWEILALVAFIWMIYTLIRDLTKLLILRWITGLALFLIICVFAWTFLWGLNNYSAPMHEKMELSGEDYSVERLKQAAIYYRDKANEASNRIKRDENGEMSYESFGKMAEEAVDSYMLLAVQYDCFKGPRFAPKRMILSDIFGIDGLFIPFSGEVCVSDDTYSACLPYVMCRQVGHGNGFTDRGEAEFAAFLACSVSDSPELRYSGYFNAFSLCYNALYAQNPEAARQVWQGVSQYVQSDCGKRVERESGQWKQTMSEFQTDLWNIYGETFQVEVGEGPTHDTVTDLLTMWYVERIV